MRELDNKYTNSHLFLVRLWPAGARDEQAEWHGKVQHVMTGRADIFDEWSTLISLLQSMLPVMEEDHKDGVRAGSQGPDS